MVKAARGKAPSKKPTPSTRRQKIPLAKVAHDGGLSRVGVTVLFPISEQAMRQVARAVQAVVLRHITMASGYSMPQLVTCVEAAGRVGVDGQISPPHDPHTGQPMSPRSLWREGVTHRKVHKGSLIQPGKLLYLSGDALVLLCAVAANPKTPVEQTWVNLTRLCQWDQRTARRVAREVYALVGKPARQPDSLAQAFLSLRGSSARLVGVASRRPPRPVVFGNTRAVLLGRWPASPAPAQPQQSL